MVSMRPYASIALCILFALHVLVHADQGKGMEGDRQTSINVQAKGVTSGKEVSVAGDGKSISGGRKMLVAKKDEGKNAETSKLSDAHQVNKDLKYVATSDNKRISKNFKGDVFSFIIDDYRTPKNHPPTPNGKNAKGTPGRSDNTSKYQNYNRVEEEEEWTAKETDKTGGMNLKTNKAEGEEEEWKVEETELMNMMGKDYKGMGKSRRKPHA